MAKTKKKGKGGKKATKAPKIDLEKWAIDQKLLYEKYHEKKWEHEVGSVLLHDSVKYFENCQRAFDKGEELGAIELEWSNYVNCVNLPQSDNLPELKKFLLKWKTERSEYAKTDYITWELGVDERSALTQDEDAKDLTWKTVAKQQPVIGEWYEMKLRDALAILNGIKKILDANKLNETVLDELFEMQQTFREYIMDFMNEMSLRVLKNIQRDMKKKDARTSNFYYSCDTFINNLWSPRPVPQKPDIVETVYHFEVPDTVVTLNKNLNFKTNGIRLLWIEFDHYSDLTATFSLQNRFTPIPDLRKANENEWQTRENFQEQELLRMNNERLAWEAFETRRLELLEQKAKEKKKAPETPATPNKKSKKNNKASAEPKSLPEPPKPNDETVIDTDEMYLEYALNEIRREMFNVHPDQLNLKHDELNLRAYRVYGGIYDISAIAQPVQTREIDKHIYQNLDRNQSINFVTNLVPEIVKKENDDVDEIIEENDTKPIRIRTKLSSEIFWWSTPMVARWMPYSQVNSDMSSSARSSQREAHALTGPKLFLNKRPKPDFTKIQIIEDFSLDSAPANLDFIEFVVRHLVPRIPDYFKFECELEETREKIRKKLLKLKEDEMEKFEQLERKKNAFEERMEADRVAKMEVLTLKLEELTATREKVREDIKRKLLNAGETVRNVGIKIKALEVEDEAYISAIEIGEVTEMQTVIDEQRIAEFPIEVTSIHKESFSKIANDMKSDAPRELYPKTIKKFPLQIVLQHEPKIVMSFDVPNTHQTYRSKELNNWKSTMVSDLLEHFESIRQAEKPLFVGQDENETEEAYEETVQELPQTAAPSQVAETLFSSDGTKTIKSNTPEYSKVLGYWTTAGISDSSFDFATNEFSFATEALGIYAFASHRYSLYPILHWRTYTTNSPQIKVQSVFLEIKTIFFVMIIETNADGFLATITQPKPIFKKFRANKEPLKWVPFKNWLLNQGIDIFPDRDAQLYTPFISEKHLALEMHTYKCITQYTVSHQFWRSVFNGFADYREIIIHVQENSVDPSLGAKEMLITPHTCLYVKTTEKCEQSNPAKMDLNFERIPEEQDFYPDPYHLLHGTSNELSLRRCDQMKLMLKYNVAKLLTKLRLLSLS